MKTESGILLVLAEMLCVAGWASAQNVVAGGAARPVAARPAMIQPETFGGAIDSYLQISASQFTPFDSSTTYNDLGNGGPFFSRYPTAGNGFFYAGVNGPDGALLSFLELDYCDTNTAGSHVHLVLYDCGRSGSGCVTMAALTSNSDGCAFVTINLNFIGLQFDNVNHRMLVSANADAFDGTNSISGAIIGYRLQVSPPPSTASFVDVPTTSPIFKFVEALKASGITAGCDATHYCPNDPLTRGQMAVFLAAGLGLQFP